MAESHGLRATAARDKDFTGIDTAAMAELIRQMTKASASITGWLRANAALPAGVARTGLHEATAVEAWVRDQPGMLTRRRDYAVAHLGGPAAGLPHVTAGGLGAAARHTTAAGAGHRVGHFPDARAALRAGTADADAVRAAAADGRPVPAAVWGRLEADAGDPDYDRGLYERLGPAGTARLIKAALADDAHAAAVRVSLGVASRHLDFDRRWLRALLAEAGREGVHDDAVRLLRQTDLDARARAALGHLGAAPPPGGHRPPVPEPRPPHTARPGPAAAGPAVAGVAAHGPAPGGHDRPPTADRPPAERRHAPDDPAPAEHEHRPVPGHAPAGEHRSPGGHGGAAPGHRRPHGGAGWPE
jgi:hypothetical protein